MWQKWIVAGLLMVLGVIVGVTGLVHEMTGSHVVPTDTEHMGEVISSQTRPVYTLHTLLEDVESSQRQRFLVHTGMHEKLRLDYKEENPRIAVYNQSGMIGYLDADTAITIRALLKEGVAVRCYAEKTTSKDGVFGMVLMLTWS